MGVGDHPSSAPQDVLKHTYVSIRDRAKFRVSLEGLCACAPLLQQAAHTPSSSTVA